MDTGRVGGLGGPFPGVDQWQGPHVELPGACNGWNSALTEPLAWIETCQPSKSISRDHFPNAKFYNNLITKAYFVPCNSFIILRLCVGSLVSFYMSPPSSAHVSAHATRLLRHVLRLLVPLAVTLTVYLYLYPFFLTCGFPLPPSKPGPDARNGLAAWLETTKLHLPLPIKATPSIAPFRLLALGDPQLEGDTSIPNYYLDTSFPHLHSFFTHLTTRSSDHPTFHRSTKQAFHDLVDFWFDDIPNTLESARKRIDLWGNDFYLAHIYRTLRWWSAPTHVTVLGDLLGSQWISDEEFERRGWRYWNKAFAGGERVPDDVAKWPASTYDVTGTLGGNDTTWQKRVLHVAGNHDIGYAGDLTKERMERFERVFGKANYEVRFELPLEVLSPAAASTIREEPTGKDNEDDGMPDPYADRLIPELRIVVLNDMNLDTPALVPELQDETYNFINDVINTASAVEYKGHFTVVLTHVPLYKAEGLCVDAPFFTFHDHDGSLKEQNQLSADASRGFVEGIFGLNGDGNAAGGGQGRRGVVLNGHDHEGCDTWHFINQTADEKTWQARRWSDAVNEEMVGKETLPGVREITVRSMMGGYGGNAGLMSAWFDEEAWEWRFEFANCALGTQYVWWAVHVVDLIAVLAVGVYGVLVLVSGDKNQTGMNKNGRVPEPVPSDGLKENKAKA